MRSDEDVVLERGKELAGACARAGVKDYQLGQVLAHLKRHRNVGATRRLLGDLVGSPFGLRTQAAKRQFPALEEKVGSALTGVSDWHKAAMVVGWAKRLLKTVSSSGGRR